MTSAWLYYNPLTRDLIVKREPFLYQIPYLDPTTGDTDILIVYGEQIQLPIWEWVKTTEGYTYAGWQQRVYDITDCVTEGNHDPK